MDCSEKEVLLGYLDSPRFVEASTNSSKLVAKLKGTIERQEFYETQQILKSIHFRFCKNKDKLLPLLDLLYHVSIYLLKNQEFTSGLETALLLVDVAAKCLQQRQDDASSPQQIEDIKSLIADSSLTNHMTNNTFDMNVCQKVATLAVGLPDAEHLRLRFIVETLKTLSPKLLNRDLLRNAIGYNTKTVRYESPCDDLD